MKQINGFSLVESIVSLLIFSLVCSFLLPISMTIFQKLDEQKENSQLYQEIFEHSELIHYKSISIHFNDNTIRSYYYKGGIQICAKNQSKERCIF
ncbi:type II secretion system protein [Listeria welshimeri]|uniref:competence type IV pilus minor pilin ComGE n=1 Tax=Listeria welshimeri TaxID=1643 RepID=UPI001851672E|nr:competence type IV pilus minor pilin ComGE [Listeria welshimeri]MBC2351158.1 type II secretion system protein [Listeria welshimeri]MBF2386675.1 type II secretion system protein [Listeria welshimeri]